jgi:uncharacterized protein (DUF697 family)
MTTTENTTTENAEKIAETEEATVNEESQSADPLDIRVARLAKAQDSVKNYTMSAVAVGLVPVPLVDITVLTALQLKLLDNLAKKYDVPFSKDLAKSLLISLASNSIAVSFAMPLASLFKSVPIIGQSSGMISTAIIGAASTYAVGKLFVAHFESGGTFLDFDIEKYKAHFKELYEEGKAFVCKHKTADVAEQVSEQQPAEATA